MKRLTKAVASAFASARQATGHVPAVIASAEVELPKGETATYTCPQCKTTAGYNSNLPSPHCVTCGHDDLEAVNDVEVEQFDKEDDLVAANCLTCGTHNIMSKATCASLENVMHCAACGTELDFQAPDEASTTFDPTDSVDLANADEDADGDWEEPQDEGTTAAGDAPDADVDSELPEDELDLVDQAEGSNLEGLEVYAGNNKVFAAIDDLPIAVLDEADAGDNADCMQTAGFMQAVKASVKTNGLKALATLGFKPITVKVNIAKIVERQVTARVTNESAKLVEERAAMRADFAHALQIAGVGLNKGFFADRSHPLKAAVFSVLTNAGVKQAASLVDQAFASVGEDFVEELLDTAESLLEKSPEVRDEIAATLKTTNYQKATVEEDDEDEDEAPTSVEARALGHGLRVTAAARTQDTPIAPGLFRKF